MRTLLVLAVVAVGGYFGAKFHLQGKVSSSLDTMLTQMRPVVDASYESATVSMLGEIQVDGVVARFASFTDPVRVDRISVITPGFTYLWRMGRGVQDLDFPERLGIEIASFRARVDADFMDEITELQHEQFSGPETLSPDDTCAGNYGFTPDTLRRLGYDELVVDARIAFEKEGDKLLFDVGTDIEDMYDVDVALALGGLTNPDMLARGMFRPMLIEGRLDYVDQSLKSRVMKHCMEDYELSKDDVIAAELTAVKTLARSSGMELDHLILGPYTEFLLGHERFVLTLQPTQPVDLTTLNLYRPSDVPHLLNLVAEAR